MLITAGNGSIAAPTVSAQEGPDQSNEQIVDPNQFTDPLVAGVIAEAEADIPPEDLPGLDHPSVDPESILAARSEETALAESIPVEPIIYNYDSGVSSEDRRSIELGNAIADKFFLNTYGFVMPYQIILDVKATVPPPGESSLYADARDGRYRIIAYTVSDWQEKSSLAHTQQIIHERTHLMQDSLSDGLTSRDHILRGPQWLLEGVAEFNGYKALAAEGLITMDRVRECGEVAITRAGTIPPLSEFGTNFNSRGFSLSLLAVDNLVTRSGITFLKTYYQLLTKMEWRDAFREAFGIGIQDFYTQFNKIHQSYPSHYGKAPSSCLIFPNPR